MFKGKHSLESIEKMRIARRKRVGWKHSPETIEKMRKAGLRRLHTKESRKKISESRKGKPLSINHRTAIANGVTRFYKEQVCGPSMRNTSIYINIHCWIRNKKGRPDHCDICGLQEKPKGVRAKNYFQWSNKSNTYRRELDDWWQLCIRCHRLYDFHVKIRRRLWKWKLGFDDIVGI